MRTRESAMSVFCLLLALLTFSDISSGSDANFQVTKISLGGSSRAIGIDDFDNDGDLDIINQSPDGIIYLHNNDGMQQFTQTTIFSGMPINDEGGDAGTADFNGDGFADFAIVDYTDKIHIFLNNGDQSFTHSEFLADRAAFTGLDCADMNGDSQSDLIIAGYDPPEVLLFYGQGNGGFNPGPRFNPDDSVVIGIVNVLGVVVGDINNDSYMDIIAGQDDDGDPGAAWLFAGVGDGSFTYLGEAYDTNPVDEGGYDFAGAGLPDAFDFDGDGQLEIITTSPTSGSGWPPGIGLFSNGDGSGVLSSFDTLAQFDSLFMNCSAPPLNFPPRHSFGIYASWTSDTALLVTYQMIGSWPMDELSSDTVWDLSGNDFYGIATNTMISPGISGNCRYLNGNDAQITMGQRPEFNLITPFSVTGWFRIDNPQDLPFIVSNAGGYRGFWFRIESDTGKNKFSFMLQGLGPLNDGPLSQTEVLPGIWYHIAAVAKSDTELEIYVNGQLDGQKTISPGYISNVVRELKIGIDPNYYHLSPPLMNGYVDEVRIYARALEAEEIGILSTQGLLCGDANDNGIVNILDVTYMLAFLYKGGPVPPIPSQANCNGTWPINILDVTYMIGYLYKNGPSPNCGYELMAAPIAAKVCHAGIISEKINHTRANIELTSQVGLMGIEITMQSLSDVPVEIRSFVEGVDVYYHQEGSEIKLGMIDITGQHMIPAGKHAILEVDGQVEIVSVLGADENSNGVTFEIVNQASKGELLPKVYSLEQNHPNPFNPNTTIEFSLPKAGDVSLEIYNIAGQKVATLVNSRLEAGNHSVTWDSRNTSGEPLASGIYLYRLKADSFVETKKMMLLK